MKRSIPSHSFFKYFKIYVLDREFKKYDNSYTVCALTRAHRIALYRSRCARSQQAGTHTKTVSSDRPDVALGLNKTRYVSDAGDPLQVCPVPRARSSMAGRPLTREKAARPAVSKRSKPAWY